jgi:hypothetical protein
MLLLAVAGEWVEGVSDLYAIDYSHPRLVRELILIGSLEMACSRPVNSAVVGLQSFSKISTLSLRETTQLILFRTVEKMLFLRPSSQWPSEDYRPFKWV